MGAEYYIADRSTKTFYVLGRGPWGALDVDIIPDPELLTLHILDDLFSRDAASDERWHSIETHVRERLVPDLSRFFGSSPQGELRVFNDCGDDTVIIKAKGYRCIGTRYGEPGSDEYNDDVSRLNRHLDGSEWSKRVYDPKQYEKYPEWEVY